MSNQQNEVLIIDEHAAARFGGEAFLPVHIDEHALARFGGEAFLPVHYFCVLRKRGGRNAG